MHRVRVVRVNKSGSLTVTHRAVAAAGLCGLALCCIVSDFQILIRAQTDARPLREALEHHVEMADDEPATLQESLGLRNHQPRGLRAVVSAQRLAQLMRSNRLHFGARTTAQSYHLPMVLQERLELFTAEHHVDLERFIDVVLFQALEGLGY